MSEDTKTKLSDEEKFDAEILRQKKQIRSWVRQEPEEFKEFIKHEYLFLYKLKRFSKKTANIITIPILGILCIGVYEAANLLLNLHLPSIISYLQI